jgi:hypothetical protein
MRWTSGKFDFKEPGGGLHITTCRGSHAPLTSEYKGLEVPQTEIKNTRIFFVGFNLIDKVSVADEVSLNVQGTALSYVITSIKPFSLHTEIVGLEKSAVNQGVGQTGETGIISRWGFGDSDDLGYDSEAKNPLTSVGTPTWSSESAPNSVPQDGSCDFERSSNERLKITDGDQTDLDFADKHTIVCRVKLESIPSAMVIVAKTDGGGGSERSYEIWIDSGGVIRYGLSADGVNATTAIGGTALSTAVWYSIAVVYDQSDIRIYLDGSLDSNGSSNPKAFTSSLFNSNQDFCIGARSDGANDFDGLVDDVRVYNVAKSASEIASWHSTGST